jgi:ring-1,2-phenylacetyl-CoA epoxidase subunit PaaE
MSQFNSIKVKEVKRETSDTVSISFEVPSSFSYQSGQYVTIKSMINGEDVRRSYSLCSAPFEDDFRVAVKKIDGGKMSTFLNESLSAGDTVEMMPPLGGFLLKPENEKHYVAFAAGSGITPILSMIKSVLSDSNSKFTLFYGNKTEDSTIFKKEIDQLIEENKERLEVNYIYSRQNSLDPLFEGRISRDKFDAIVKNNLDLIKADGFFLCGPEQMINEVSEGLNYLGVNETKIHFELFVASAKPANNQVQENEFSGKSNLTVIMDGEEFEFDLDSSGEFILDAAIGQGVDAPFSCKGAVCCTCKAQVIEGKAIMEMNYALSDAEVEEGFILSCQARPASEKLVVDFDVI